MLQTYAALGYLVDSSQGATPPGIYSRHSNLIMSSVPLRAVAVPVAARTVLPEHNLDILRAVAVLSVLVAHWIDNMSARTPVTTWLGHAGVLTFFVHTALVLMSSLERDDAPAREGWIRRFYVRRALRIYPLAWAVILFVVLMKIPAGSIDAPLEPRSLLTVLSNLALVQNWAGAPNVIGPLWTLPLEMQMYLVLPFFFLLARKPSGRWYIIAAILVGIGIAYVNEWGTDPAHRIPGLWRVQIPEFIPCFLLGVFAYALLRVRKNEGALPSWSWLPIIAAGLTALGWLWVQGRENYHASRWVYCAILALAIPLVRDATPSLLTRFGHVIAKYSYGIYLIHVLAMRLGFGVFRQQSVLIKSGISFVTLAIACFAAYHVIEKPGIALGQRLLKQRVGPPPLEATAPAP